jgi:hypothetical protein
MPASRMGSGSIMDVDDFAGFESSYITFTQFLQGGLKMPESYYSEYQEVKVQPGHSNVNSQVPFSFLHLLQNPKWAADLGTIVEFFL